MSNCFKRIFSSASQSPDGLTQGHREAMVDVLFYCMYADNNIALKDDKIIGQ